MIRLPIGGSSALRKVPNPSRDSVERFETRAGSNRQRFAFICGLHRSGTSLLTRCLGAHPEVSRFENTGRIEDEGQYLQTVLPRENILGGAGRFGFDPAAHMTEESLLNSEDAAQALQAQWFDFWDATKPVLVEKTPSNLLRMRLLNRLFHPSYFIVITRHPAAACLATAKWTHGNLFKLLAHWIYCYRIAREDCRFLDRVMWLSYESLVENPLRELARVTEFLELPPITGVPVEVHDANALYFDLWTSHVCGDQNHAIQPPDHPVSPPKSKLTEWREKWRRTKRETIGPPYRRDANLANFYDAIDAHGMLGPAFAEFGYSLADLGKAPKAFSSLGVPTN